MYAPTDQIQFSATAARAFRAPNLSQLFITSASIANPDLKLEKGTSYDLGFNFHPNRTLLDWPPLLRELAAHLQISPAEIADL